MKKVLAVIAVVTVVFAAGTALAQGRGNDNRRQFQPPQFDRPHFDQRSGQKFAGEPRFNMPPAPFDGECPFGMGRRNGEHRGLMFAPDMPEEIKAKAVEAAKLKIDLDALMSAKPIDQAKAIEVFTKIQKAEQDIEVWKFSKRLERIEEFRKQRELNRNVPPVPPAPEAPADEAE